MKQFLIILAIIILGFMGYQYFIRGKISSQPNNPMGGNSLENGIATLENTNWNVVQIGSVEVPDAGITAAFADGRLGGKDGCNNYSTMYQLDEENITIDSQIAGTLMACDEATMVLGSLYTKTLTEAVKYSIEGDTLSLLNNSGNVVITLRKQTQTLVGPIWEVTGYNNGKGGVTSLLAETSLSLAFEGDSSLKASACNAFTGTYSSNDTNDIGIAELALTEEMPGCIASDVLEQETQFIEAVKKSTTYEREWNRLTLRDAEGNTQITATAVYAL